MNYCFASDNTAGICPEALEAMCAANAGYEPSYGDDLWTARAADGFRELFACACDVYFVFNGTAANSLALASLCQSYHSVIASTVAHVETDECGAPEFFSNGTKLLLAEQTSGRMAPEAVEQLVLKRTDLHYPRPRAVSLTQATEFGTVYTPAQIAALSAVARRHGLRLHMDGARLANALAELGVAPAETTWRAGVDVVCFGGTKNGIGLSEAVIFFDRKLSEEFAYRCKQAGQLGSKMRLLAAPWAAALESGFWLSNARHANALAAQLEGLLRAIPGVRPLHPREANAVFVDLPEAAHGRLREKGWAYYRFIGGGARFMCSWATRAEDVQALATAVRASVAG